MKLNRKGYMLVEIILASVIAFGIAYFILSMTINLKNSNDDLFVETLITTDKTIISNKLMSYAIAEKDDFDCSKITIVNNSIMYDGNVIDIVNSNANIGVLKCDNSLGEININIPLSVKQMPDNNYDLMVNYKYDIGDMIAPNCSLALNGASIVASYSDNDGGSGIAYAGWGSDFSSNANSNIAIDHAGTYTYYVKDKAGNMNTCDATVAATTKYYDITTHLCSRNVASYNETKYSCDAYPIYTYNCTFFPIESTSVGRYKYDSCGYSGCCWGRVPAGYDLLSESPTQTSSGISMNSSTSNNVATCTATPAIECNWSNYNAWKRTYTTCKENYNYAFTTKTATSATADSSAAFSCSESNYNKSYKTASAAKYKCNNNQTKINDSYCYVN